MKRRIGPSRPELSRIKLEPGERFFIEYLCDHLPKEWEIYVEPPLNGQRPDVIVMNPAVGIGIFEVKNWNLPLYSVVNGQIIGRSEKGQFRPRNPLFQAQSYRSNIFRLLAPSLGLDLARNAAEGTIRGTYACVRLGLVFPHANATQAAARALMLPFMSSADREHVRVIGRDTLDRGKKALPDVLQDANLKRSKYFKRDIADELRRWISEPVAEREQREPLSLTRRQHHIATTRTKSGFRRVKGAAGSGKSQALAARAAQLALEEKSVLVCAFNITMVNYLPDIAVRYKTARSAVRQRCHFTWFHHWCHETIVQLAGDSAWSNLFKYVSRHDIDHVLRVEVPNKIRQLAIMHPHRETFDAILVDEGQDWEPDWWNVLRLFSAPGGEMLLVADQTQDIYRRSEAWTDEAMTGAGFPGGSWFQLAGSHRVHPAAVPMLRDFTNKFIPNGVAPAEAQLELSFGNIQLFWVNAERASPGQLVSKLLRRLPTLLENKDTQYTDTTVLVQDHETGLQFCADLELPGANIGHVFHQDRQIQRALKIKFRKGMAKLKACTIASFKGWEDRVIILVISEFDPSESGEIIFTALSRVKRTPEGSCLIVVCSTPILRDFGKQWFVSITEAELLTPDAGATQFPPPY